MVMTQPQLKYSFGRKRYQKNLSVRTSKSGRPEFAIHHRDDPSVWSRLCLTRS